MFGSSKLRGRRRLVGVTLATTLFLASCGGGGGDDSAGADTSTDGGGGEPVEETELTFTLWGGEVEIEAFRALADQFEDEHPGVTVSLDRVPFDGIRERIDTGLIAGDPPDIFRVTYTDIGAFSSEGVLADVGEFVDDDFLPSFEAAVTFDDTVFGVPHHTDTSAIIYRADYMEQIGVEPPTENLEDAWTWDEFMDVARRLQEETDAEFGFMYNFQLGGAFRWLNLLYQNGGSLTSDDFSEATIDSDVGLETLEFTKSWFDEGIVPPNSSVKTSERNSDLFPTGTIGMAPMGNFVMPSIDESGVPWGVTFLPQQEQHASEVGGNAVVVPVDGDNVELASEFAGFLGSEDAMRQFVTQAGFLPVRQSLTEEELEFDQFSEQMQIYVKQASAIPQHLVEEVTHPNFSEVNQALIDELDLTFVGGQDPQTTLDKLADVVEETLVTTE